MSNKPGGLRRAGRRKSTPTSPTSPTFLRRLNKSQDVFSPADATPMDSPSIDLTLPEPTFDLASISPALASGNLFTQRPQSMNRASDDFGKSRPKFLAETMRPATSNAEGSSWDTVQPRYNYSPDPTGSRDSPQFAGARTSSEEYGRFSGRENQDGALGPAVRGVSLMSLSERGAVEDGAVGKDIANTRKSRFNLRSPMSLFARRRSSQNTNKLDDGNVGVATMHVPAMPDNIETSIRGSFVHDFSQPRNRRSHNEASPRPTAGPSPSYPRRPSDMALPSVTPSIGTPSSQHSAMFREHFQEEQRLVQPKNTAYLQGQSLQQTPSSHALPSFAKRLPLNLPDSEDPIMNASEEIPASDAILPPEPEMPPPPPPVRERTPSPVLDLPPISALPKHMTSTSSRFSFQIGQQGSIAQEKLLEEKHKEHASKMPATGRMSVTSMDMDDYDYEHDMDDDDGFDNDEVTIKNIDMPSYLNVGQSSSTFEDDYGRADDNDGFDSDGIVIRNVDMPSYQNLGWNAPTEENEYHEDYENHDFGTEGIVIRNVDVPTSERQDGQENSQHFQQHSLQGFHFTPQSLSFSPSTAQYTSMSTPRDLEGFAIGMAQSKESTIHDSLPQIRNSLNESPETRLFEGLGISNVMGELQGKAHLPTPQPFDDADLYFDDGEFDDNVVELGTNFNEEMLDDAEHIRDIPAENSRKYEEALQRSLSEEQARVVPDVSRASKTLPEMSQDEITRAESPGSNRKDPFQGRQNGLTEGNLAAYHDALALAATQAAANGKFDRVVSFSRTSDDETDSPFHNSVPALSSRGSKYSNKMMESGLSDDDGFGIDDDLDDDAMIAAANAEALENDDDGFYGQEFGFYARAHGKDSVEFSSGGYFTSRGSNGIKRSHSGKNNFQEPSLTPITERSEWSTRNSVAGVPGAGQSLPSPSFADLLGRDSPIVEDEMSMNALMRLRGKAFGGSSTSINSSVDRHLAHSSPLAHLSGYNPGLTDSFVGRMSSPTPGRSAMSIAESEDEDEDWGRATLTQNTPHKKHADPVSQSSQDQLPSSPISRKGNHSRNSSGSESVSYARDGDGRWVLERRRTGDDGELVEREYVAGLRI